MFDGEVVSWMVRRHELVEPALEILGDTVREVQTTLGVYERKAPSDTFEFLSWEELERGAVFDWHRRRTS